MIIMNVQLVRNSMMSMMTAFPLNWGTKWK